MKITDKQKNEIECLDYFSPKNFDYSKVSSIGGHYQYIIETAEGIDSEEAFIQKTCYGKDIKEVNNKSRYIQLLDAQKWRLRMMDEYEQGVLDGSTPYYTLLGFESKPVPEYVMKFMARTMFKGEDKNLITKFYYSEIKSLQEGGK